MNSLAPRYLIVGLGVQGKKREKSLAGRLSFSVDPLNVLADFTDLRQVPLEDFDAAFVCTPDKQKPNIIKYLLENKKHVLCEKPLLLSSEDEYHEISKLALINQVSYYTAYNHRFEPSIQLVKSMIDSDVIGKIYSVRVFYGNGTAKLVSDSPWRDSDSGVLADLGSHAIDLINYFMPAVEPEFTIGFTDRQENLSPDHVLLFSLGNKPRILLELTLLSWKNTFECRFIGERGSIILSGLGKWGVSTVTINKRVFPAGVPIEEIFQFPQGDSTWETELDYFESILSLNSAEPIMKDRWIYQKLSPLINKVMPNRQ